MQANPEEKNASSASLSKQERPVYFEGWDLSCISTFKNVKTVLLTILKKSVSLYTKIFFLIASSANLACELSLALSSFCLTGHQKS